MLANEVGFKSVKVIVYGNAMAATAVIQGLAQEDLPKLSLLDETDEDYQITLGLVAIKMTLSKVIKKAINKIRNILKKIKTLFEPKSLGAILTLHRVDKINPDKLWYNEHLKLSPQYLENFIIEAKTKGFTFVSLDDLEIAITKNKGKKLLAITLDDGYRDNFEKGLPIFKKHNVPFCIYVSTGMIEKKFLFWWYIIEDIINEQDEIILSTGKKFDCSTKFKKEESFLAIRDIILSVDQKSLHEKLPLLFNRYKVDCMAYNDSFPLTWKQIQLLAKEPLATIGNHTHSHFAFTSCTHDEIKTDITISQKLLIEHISVKSKHFAFPFGSEVIDASHIELLKTMGFITSATTTDGFVHKNTDMFALPRLFLTEKNGDEVIKRIKKKC